MSDEAREKRALALAVARSAGFDGLLATTPATVRWLLCGRGRPVDASSPEAAYSVLVTGERAVVLTPNIEAPRVAAEERLEELGFEVVAYPWSRGRDELVADLGARRRVGSDVDLEPAIAPLRRNLAPAERDRYANAGADTAAAIVEVIGGLSSTMREVDLAAELVRATRVRGFFTPVVLVAGDERQRVHRHPLPTAAQLGRHALLALTAERDGLYVSLSRLISFGPPPPELAELVEAVAAVDAAVLAASLRSPTLGDAFDVLINAYAQAGHPDEWRHHHQGGLTGYRGREVFAVPGSDAAIPGSCAVAWNPSITGGAKSEDTALVGPDRIDVVTRTPELPELSVDGLRRPGIVEI